MSYYYVYYFCLEKKYVAIANIDSFVCATNNIMHFKTEQTIFHKKISDVLLLIFNVHVIKKLRSKMFCVTTTATKFINETKRFEY